MLSVASAAAAAVLGAAGAGILLLRAAYRRAAIRPAPSVMASAAAGRATPLPNRLPNRLPILATLPSADVAFGLDAVSDPQSPFAREIRKVHDAIAACAATGQHSTPSVLVAACDDADDTAAAALALAAATAATERVLLIDADLGRRTLAALDADHGDAGLVDVAIGRRALPEVIGHDRDTNINLMPFVTPNSRRTRAITEADLERAFDEARRFDLLIVAAMDLGRDPGTLFFAAQVDHIVVVTRPGAADQHAVAQFLTALGADADKVRGAVLTGVDEAA